MKALSIVLLIFSSVCLFSCSKTEGFGNIDSLEGTVWEYESQHIFGSGPEQLGPYDVKKVLRFDKTTFYYESHDVDINLYSREIEEEDISWGGSYLYDAPKLTMMNPIGSGSATIIGEYMQFEGGDIAEHMKRGGDIMYKRIK
jgi:hypothetical protein